MNVTRRIGGLTWLGLGTQAFLSRLVQPLFYPMYILLLRYVLSYRIPDLPQVRRGIREKLGRDKRPLLICPNHLTMIDSVILMWAIAPWWQAFWDARFFPWNTPEKTNYAHVPVLRFIAYLGKCIAVVRQAPKDQTAKFLAKLRTLLLSGQSLMIFPEGTRSRHGRVETKDFAYGTGKIVDDLKRLGAQPRILCVYLRGLGQKTYSTIPRKGETFYLDYQVLEPTSDSRGLRAQRDISRQIVHTLADMEQAFFAGGHRLKTGFRALQ
ncbi:MAG: lysophospholipid acyltransferase family protein [Spirochaeta sp.]|nr:lysophospholipid acyltransferase family protein [Spirochaeta sp.]